MRRLFLILFLAALHSAVDAQSSNSKIDADTIDASGFNINGFVFVGTELFSVQGDLLNGIIYGAGIIIKDRFLLGGFAGRMEDGAFNRRLVFPNQFTMKFIHGGGLAGYKITSIKNYEITIENRISFGHVRWLRSESGSDFVDSSMMIIQPGIGVDFNPMVMFKSVKRNPGPLHDIIRINLNVGYRIMSGLVIQGLEDGDFNSPVIGLSLKVGYFK